MFARFARDICASRDVCSLRSRCLLASLAIFVRCAHDVFFAPRSTLQVFNSALRTPHSALLKWVCCCAFVTALPLPAQTPSLYQLDFRKDYISWMWQGKLQSAIKTGKQSQLTLNEQFSSNLFRQSAQGDKWRDDNEFRLAWRQPLSRVFQTRSLIDSKIFSDENAGREFSRHLLAQELTVQLHPQVRLTPALGLAVEEAFNNRDQGWYTRAGLKIDRLDMGGYINNSDLNSTIRAFPGRRNLEHSFFTGWSKDFSQYASDSLRIGYQLSESRYFINPGQSSILEAPREQVVINARFLANQLQYRLSERSFLAVLTNLKNRSIDQQTPSLSIADSVTINLRKEFSLENQIQHLIFSERFRIQNGILFSQVRNDNPGFNTDINTLQTAFSSTVQFTPSRRDLLWSKFSYSKFEYNTPNASDRGGSGISLNNREDRDEQRFIFDAGYRHRFSPYFAATVKGNLYLFHQIYIRSGRSQNNNWNRIYQMSALFDHQLGERVRHDQQIKILANYTVFDFEELLPQVRSYVFRKLVYTDSLSIGLTDNLSYIQIYQLEKEDNGTFFQKSFTQQVSKELTAHFLNFNLQHQDVLGLKVTSGVTLFLRDEWQFTPSRERKRVRAYRSITPRFTVLYPAGERLLLYFTYAPNRSTNRFRSINTTAYSENIQYFTSGNVNLQYRF